MVNHTSIYLPITFNHVATNFERNLFTTCSGQILYTKQEKQIGSIKGFAGFQNTLCKYNLFDQALTKKFTSHDYKNKNMHDLSLNLNLITLTPIKMRSPSLETNAHANLKIMGSISNPQMIGQVNLIGGKLHFPAKPLQIAHGKIYFTAEQPDAPLIDLVAKNKIKNYAVTMHVNGSINSPYIILESSPTLNEEQIGTLLLLGTDNTSLNMMMPALIMQNINQTVFGAIADENQTNSLIKKLLKPLDRIKFVPSFSDETGRAAQKEPEEIKATEGRLRQFKKTLS